MAVAHTLVLAEHAIGKQVLSPADLKRLVPVIEQFHVLTLKALCDLGLLQDHLLAVVVEGELGADVALFAVTEDVV